MKRYIILATLFCFFLHSKVLFGQEKLVIDSNTIKNWVSIGKNRNVNVSNDGNYFCYTIDEGYPLHSKLIVQSTSGDWKMEFQNAKPETFSLDNKKFIFSNKDSLAIISLGTDDVKYIKDVGTIRQPADNRGQLIVFQQKSANHKLVLLDILTETQHYFNNVIDYQISDNASALFLKMSNDGIGNSSSLEVFDMPNGHALATWNFKDSTFEISSIAIDKMGEQVAFQAKKRDSKETGIWYWKKGMNKPLKKINWPLNQKVEDLVLLPSLSFSSNGKYIFFLFRPYSRPMPLQDPISVDVWYTKDTLVQSMQLKNPYSPPFTGVVRISDGKFVKITSDWDIINKIQTGESNYIVVTHNSTGDRFWLNIPDSNWLVCLCDSSKVLLKTQGFSSFAFSPNGKYLLYYDSGQKGHYFSYELQTGKVIPVSKNIPDYWLLWQYDFYFPKNKIPPGDTPAPVGIAGFTDGGNSVLVYDNYDIWKLDLKGLRPAINITNGYGRRKHIKFRILTDESDPTLAPDFSKKNHLVLTAFDTETQYNGFYEKDLLTKGDPLPLTMGPFFFYFGTSINRELNNFSSNFRPLKASASNKWIVKRESPIEAPNLFITEDFKYFKPLTNLEPQKKYNWVSSERITFKASDSITIAGILYKPENFDSSKKYPVLFNIYRTFSQRLYQFPVPYFTEDAHINIPWFTSQGYLIFTPDICVKGPGLGAESALLTVEASIEQLKKYPYVDGAKIGLTGHSMAGGLVSYIISHTSKFAVAFEGAGNTDPISAMLAIDRNLTAGSQLAYENSFGTTIWENPDLYLKRSTILSADKILTPLLIFHCKNDGGVLFEQGMELFLSLRRLGKIAWLLQYDQGYHSVSQKAAEDLTIRVNQFFDHYLKGAPAPIWISHGIPARFKGIEFGYSYDPSGKCGTQNCKICKYWNEKFKKDSAACWKEIDQKTKSEHWMGGGEAAGQKSEIGKASEYK